VSPSCTALILNCPSLKQLPLPTQYPAINHNSQEMCQQVRPLAWVLSRKNINSPNGAALSIMIDAGLIRVIDYPLQVIMGRN
jgi:hypothetical protein